MDIVAISHNEQRVLTTSNLADSFGTDQQILVNNFNRNKERYTEGKHFIFLQGDELRDFRAKNQIDLSPSVNRLYLWTEKGAWLHAKSLNTDQAWEAYEGLVDDYYRIKSDAGLNVEALSPQLQFMIQMEQKQNELEQRQAQLELEQQETGQTITTIKETLLQRDEDWRNKINGMMKGASFRMGGNYDDLRRRSYEMLDERAHCNLKIRLNNLLERLEEQGATKTQLRKTSRMDVIEAEPRLKEIYTTIVKELTIGTLV